MQKSLIYAIGPNGLISTFSLKYVDGIKPKEVYQGSVATILYNHLEHNQKLPPAIDQMLTGYTDNRLNGLF